MMMAKNRNYVRNSLVLNKIAMNTARIAHREMKKKDPQISVAGIKKISWYQQELIRKYLCTSTQETA